MLGCGGRRCGGENRRRRRRGGKASVVRKRWSMCSCVWGGLLWIAVLEGTTTMQLLAFVRLYNIFIAKTSQFGRARALTILIVPSQLLLANVSLATKFQYTLNTSLLCSCQLCTGNCGTEISNSFTDPSPHPTTIWFSCASDHAVSKRESCVSYLGMSQFLFPCCFFVSSPCNYLDRLDESVHLLSNNSPLRQIQYI